MAKSSIRGWAVSTIAMTTLVGATLYPSNLDENYATARNGHKNEIVKQTEAVGRHTNVVLPLTLALVTRDWRGLGQIGLTAFGTAMATRGQKHLLNDIVIGETRLGQRPLSTERNHNMPSGHSSAAAAGAWFTMRRYSMWFGTIVIPILLLTMYARVMLDAHTISATIAGAATGIIVAELVTKQTSQLGQHFTNCARGLWKIFFAPWGETRKATK